MAFAFAGTYGPELINDSTGRPLSDLTVWVYAHTTTTPVPLYTDRTMATQMSNPIQTDIRGNLTFYCAPGMVDIVGNNARLSVQIPADPADVTEKYGDTMLGALVLSGDPAVNLGAATKEYVDTHEGGGGAVTSVFGRAGAVAAHTGDYTVAQITGAAAQTDLTAEVARAEAAEALLAPKASPTFTGTPLAPTASFGTNTTQLATTAFVAAAVAAGSVTLTGDVTTIGNAATLQLTVNVEQILRDTFLDQIAPPQGAVWLNGQNLTGVGTLSFASGGGFGTLASFTVADGTAAHGSVILGDAPTGPSVKLFGNTADTFSVLALGELFGQPGMFFGPGGSTTVYDVSFARGSGGSLAITTASTLSITASSLTMADGTVGDGSISLSLDNPLIGFKTNSTDAFPSVETGVFFGVPILALGSGSSAPDVNIGRPSANTLGLTASAGVTMTKAIVQDGTAAHGALVLTTNLPTVGLYANIADANPIAVLKDILGVPAIGFGAGGASALDITISRSAANTVTVGASAGTLFTGPISHNDGTAGHGLVATALNQPALNIFANSGDANPTALLESVGGVGLLAFGAGGSSATDVQLSRSAANTLSIGASAGVVSSGPISQKDATAAHGLVVTGLNPAALSIYGSSSDTQPLIQLVNFSGLGVADIALGAGGSSATDTSLSRGGANLLKLTASAGVVFTGPIIGSPSTTQTLAAGTTVNPNALCIAITATGPITLTATPTITAGTAGQVVEIVNVGSNAITFQSNGTLASSNLSLGSTTRVVGAKGSLRLVYNGTLTRWVETGFNAGGNG